MHSFASGIRTITIDSLPIRLHSGLGQLIGLAFLVGLWSTSALAIPAGLGATHSCFRTPTGGVQCAGTNLAGELGNGTTVASATPVDVTGLSSGVTDVAAGGDSVFEDFSCALTSAGAVKCWGGSGSNGSATDESTPFNVPGLSSGVTAIAAGGAHACAVIAGGVKCWGVNSSGQLGNNSTVDSETPVDVTGLGAGSGVISITAGDLHTCAGLANGIKCWGSNAQGQLGDGSQTDSPVPVDVSGGAFAGGVDSPSAGSDHTCAVTLAGAALCWGGNFYGQLGDGTTNDSFVPAAVSGLGSGVEGITAGLKFTCAFTSAGAAKCWGYGGNGEWGQGGQDPISAFPLNVYGLQSGVAGIIAPAGGSHVCALVDGTTVKCWGRNDQGQFGNGTTTLRTIPTDVVGLGSGVTAVAADENSSCAVANGGVKCWGGNEFTGQLGDGTEIDRRTPVDVVGLGAGSGVTAVAVGGVHACALTNTNGVKCWGQNTYGQLGDGNSGVISTTPVDVTGLTSGVLAIAAGEEYSCALTSSNGVKCWGRNNGGQIGDNSLTDRNLPTDVTNLTSGVAAIAAGYDHACAVTSGGAVKCWGRNTNGGLGDGTTNLRKIPVDVQGLTSGFSTVGAGTGHSCARSTTGGVKCWGRNSRGELGDGTVTQSLVPVDVLGLSSGVAQLVVGRSQSCVVTNSGGLKCWGRNDVGAVGDGSNINRSSPVDVVGLASGVAVVGEEGLNTCAATNSGALKCWGQNRWGQVGDGTNWGIPSPKDSLFTLTPATSVDLIQVPPLPPPASSGSSGASVWAAPEIVVVGAPNSDADGTTAGQVFVYTPGNAPAAKAKFRDALRSGKSIKEVQDLNLATLQMPPELANLADKFGGAVAVSHDGDTIAVGAPNQNNNRGAIYIFKKPADGWTGKVLPSQAPLTVPAPVNGDGLGTALAITNSGTIIAGVPGAGNGAGAVYVIRKGDTTYTMSATGITSSPSQAGAGFGSSVSGEGSDIAIGAPNLDAPGRVDQGQVQMFREAGGAIGATPIAVVNDPNAAAGDHFGASVAINDGTLIVGAPGHDRPAAPNSPAAIDAGAAVVFDQASDGTATPIATLTDPTADAGAALGSSVTLTNGTAVIGEPNVDINGNVDQGGALVYTASETTSITGTPVADGQLFDPFGGGGDHYGTAVYFGGGLLVSGSPDAGTQAARSAKSTSDVKPGEAIAYSDSVIFKSGMESPRGVVGSCVTLNQAIPDPGEITSPDLLLTATGNVKDLNISVRIDHTFVSDLRLTLIHGTEPNTRSVPLYIPAGACNGDNMDVTFDDQALDGFAKVQCSGGTPTIDGRFLPNDWLTIMQGVSRAGPWRLKVTDTLGGGTGSLVSWCVDAR